MKRRVTIVGGGLAGLTLAILLRREGIEATVIEAGKYPRHRVCGEFISGHGRQVLKELGLNLPGAREAADASFHLPGRVTRFAMPEKALCISRFKLDALLAAEFQKLGGELRLGQRAAFQGEGIVRASGRRPANGSGAHLVGLKAHARNAHLSTDLEMHLGPRRYVGLCKCDDDLVNVCGLFYFDRGVPDLADTWRQRLRDAMNNEALAGALWDEDSVCVVAALNLSPAPQAPGEFSIGDAAAMIPPVTGNGMSMAFESAALACGPLLRYASGFSDWMAATTDYQRLWKRRFGARLRWASWLQNQLFRPSSQRALAAAVKLVPALAQTLFNKTR